MINYTKTKIDMNHPKRPLIGSTASLKASIGTGSVQLLKGQSITIAKI